MMKTKTLNRILAGLCAAEAVLLSGLYFAFNSRTNAPPPRTLRLIPNR